MMILLLISVYVLIGFLISIFITRQNRINGFVGAYSGFMFGLMLYFVIIPILLILKLDEFSNKYLLVYEFIEKKEPLLYFYSILFFICALMAFHLFYKIFLKINLNFNKHVSRKVLRVFSKTKAIKLFSFSAYFTLVVGGTSLLLFFSAFGGVLNALSIAETNRSFSSSTSDFIDYRLSLLIIPARFVTVAPYLFMFLILSREKKLDKILFIISFILAILFFVFNAGRAALVIFLLTFVYMYLKKNIKKVWSMLVLVGIALLPLLDLIDNFFLYLNTQVWRNIEFSYLSYIYQFSHPYRNTLNMIDMKETYGLAYGKDFVTAIINFIPGMNFEKSYENTSHFYLGEKWNIFGGIPNDVITFGYLQFGLIGIILVCGTMGFIFGVIDKSLSKFPKGDVRNFLSAILVLNTFLLVGSADFESILRTEFILIVISILIVFSTNIKSLDNG